MNCTEFRDKLGDPTTLNAVETDHDAMLHVAGCKACRSRLDYEKQLADGFSQIGNRQPPVALADRVIAIPAAERRNAGSSSYLDAFLRKYWLHTSLATGFAVLFLGVSVSFLFSPSNDLSEREKKATPPRISLPRNQFAAAPSTETGKTSTSGGEGNQAPAPNSSAAPDANSSTDGGAAHGGAAPAVTSAFSPQEPNGAVAEKTGETSATTVFMLARADGAAKEKQVSSEELIAPRPIAYEAPVDSKLVPPPPSAPSPADDRRPQSDLALDSAQVPLAPSEIAAFAPGAEGNAHFVRGEPLNDEAEDEAPPLQLAKSKTPATKEIRARLSPIKAKVRGKSKAKDKFNSEAESEAKSEAKREARRDVKGEAGALDPFDPKVRSAPSAEGEEILMTKGSGAGAKMLENGFTKEDNSVMIARAPRFAPSPSSVHPTAAMAQKKLENSGRVGGFSRDSRHERIEEVMREHFGEIREGPLDINQWVISDWISVKERIFLAPPPGYRWVSARRGQRWEAILQNKSGS